MRLRMGSISSSTIWASSILRRKLAATRSARCPGSSMDSRMARRSGDMMPLRVRIFSDISRALRIRASASGEISATVVSGKVSIATRK